MPFQIARIFVLLLVSTSAMALPLELEGRDPEFKTRGMIIKRQNKDNLVVTDTKVPVITSGVINENKLTSTTDANKPKNPKVKGTQPGTSDNIPKTNLDKTVPPPDTPPPAVPPPVTVPGTTPDSPNTKPKKTPEEKEQERQAKIAKHKKKIIDLKNDIKKEEEKIKKLESEGKDDKKKPAGNSQKDSDKKDSPKEKGTGGSSSSNNKTSFKVAVPNVAPLA